MKTDRLMGDRKVQMMTETAIQPVLLMRHDAVARILVNGSWVSLKAVLPLDEMIATSSDRCSKTVSVVWDDENGVSN